MQEKLDSIYTIKAISFHTFLFRNLFYILNFGKETYLKKYMLNTLFQFNPWKVALMKWNKCTIHVIYSLVEKTKWIDSYCLSKLFVLSANGQSQATAVGFSSQSQIATNSQTRDRGPKSPLPANSFEITKVFVTKTVPKKNHRLQYTIASFQKFDHHSSTSQIMKTVAFVLSEKAKSNMKTTIELKETLLHGGKTSLSLELGAKSSLDIDLILAACVRPSSR